MTSTHCKFVNRILHPHPSSWTPHKQFAVYPMSSNLQTEPGTQACVINSRKQQFTPVTRSCSKFLVFVWLKAVRLFFFFFKVSVLLRWLVWDGLEGGGVNKVYNHSFYSKHLFDFIPFSVIQFFPHWIKLVFKKLKHYMADYYAMIEPSKKGRNSYRFVIKTHPFILRMNVLWVVFFLWSLLGSILLLHKERCWI